MSTKYVVYKKEHTVEEYELTESMYEHLFLRPIKFKGEVKVIGTFVSDLNIQVGSNIICDSQSLTVEVIRHNLKDECIEIIVKEIDLIPNYEKYVQASEKALTRCSAMICMLKREIEILQHQYSAQVEQRGFSLFKLFSRR